MGKAEAQLGDLVGPGAGSVLTTISQIQPIKVVFFLSEQEYLRARPALVLADNTALEDRKRNLQLTLANGDVYPNKGVFDFINRQVDPRTGTIEVVSLFSNPEYILRPGQFALVNVQVDTLHDAIVVPQRAVSELQGTYYQVVVVGEGNKVEIRTVTPGIRTGSDWVITSGLEKGDTIVVEGGQKLKSGMKINPQPYTPTPTPTPSPTASADAAPIPTPGPTVTPPGTEIIEEAAKASSPDPAASPAPEATPSPQSSPAGGSTNPG